jgi:hypothetical protein
VLLVSVSGQSTSAADDDSKPIATTLCNIVARPEKFANKRVRFQASFVSDGIERSLLIHSGCKQGIVPYPAADGKTRPDVEAFDKAINMGRRGTADKTVVAVFTGRFVWSPSKRVLEI